PLGDTLQLRNPQGQVVDQVTWGANGVAPPPSHTRETLQRNLATNSWVVAQENPVSNASPSSLAPQNALFVPIALKAYQSWDTGVQVQNLGSQPANVFVNYYTQQGTLVAAEPLAAVAVGASKTYFLPASPGLPGNFFGSAVITATQAIAGIVNLTN